MVLQKSLTLLFVSIVALILGVLASISPKAAIPIVIILVISIALFTLMFKRFSQTMILLCCFLLVSLFLFPSLSIGEIKLRAEDFAVIFITLSLLFCVVYKKINIDNLTPTYFWLLLYLVYSFLISAIRISFSDLEPIYLLFFIKEVQYFVYFLAFSYLGFYQKNFSSKFNKTFLVLSVITILWGVFQLLTGNIRGYYGIGIISVQNPSQSGVVCYIMALFLLYMSLTAEKKIHSLVLYCLTCVSVALTVATISRTAILVTVATFLIYIFISMFRRKWNIKKICIAFFGSIILIPFGYGLVGSMASSILERFSRFDDGADTRWSHWIAFLEKSDTYGYFIGNGKGFMQVIVGSFVLQADSQYVRLIIEVGIAGLILWIFLMFSIIIFCLNNLKSNYYDSLFLLLLTLGFMMLGVTQEAYIVAIQGSIYWILTGFFIGKILKKKNEMRANYIQ